MRVALVKPPHVGSLTRGVGFYTARLYKGLLDLKVNMELVDLSYFPTSYSTYDLVHFTYFDPFFLTLPPFVGKKTIVTVHDLTPLLFPEGFPRGIKGEIKWQIQKGLISRAKSIITVSKTSKNDIAEVLNYPKDKIFVTYEAAAEEFRRIPDIKKDNSILYVGDVNYNKNISGLIRAFSKLPQQYNLVLVGKAFLDDSLVEIKQIKKQIQELNLTYRVKFLGFVESKDLVRFYNRAVVYVQPSIYEGFGLPVVEAMACGTPVVCGHNSSLIEIGGNAVIYADVTNPNDLADRILSARNISSQKLIAQAKKFNWHQTASETLSVYKKLI